MSSKKCSKCLEVKSTTEFHGSSTSSDGLQSHCKECQKAARKRIHRENKAVGRLTSNQRYYRRLKIEALEAYGGVSCACCTETHLEFLGLDHVGGGGTKIGRNLVVDSISTGDLKMKAGPPVFVCCATTATSRLVPTDTAPTTHLSKLDELGATSRSGS